VVLIKDKGVGVRTETDSLGDVNVPENALYGAQTQRAIQNFPVSGRGLPQRFIVALLLVKRAAARSNQQLGLLERDVAQAIDDSVTDLLSRPDLMSHFPVDIYQTGSGTSTNMNANEVLAHLASERLGQAIHPNDHINLGQSSNDVIPTALHVSAALMLREELLPALEDFVSVCETKADSLKATIKTGRTHLMDAMPVTMSDTVKAWASQMRANQERLLVIAPALQAVVQGGTAVGTGVNTHVQFSGHFVAALSHVTGFEFTVAEDRFAGMSAQDTVVALSGHLRTCAVSLIKIANDLRWMNSGPLAGLGEIGLEALQPGSSIMPGKVNPVIPESAAMAGTQVIGFDTAIALAGQSGNFELNVMLPLMAANVLESMQLLTNSMRLLAHRAIASFTVNESRLEEALSRNPILATALNPIVGYEKAAEIAKQAYAEGRPILDVALDATDLSKAELQALLDPVKLARPHDDEAGKTE